MRRNRKPRRRRRRRRRSCTSFAVSTGSRLSLSLSLSLSLIRLFVGPARFLATGRGGAESIRRRFGRKKWKFRDEIETHTHKKKCTKKIIIVKRPVVSWTLPLSHFHRFIRGHIRFVRRHFASFCGHQKKKQFYFVGLPVDIFLLFPVQSVAVTEPIDEIFRRKKRIEEEIEMIKKKQKKTR